MEKVIDVDLESENEKLMNIVSKMILEGRNEKRK